MSFIQLKDVSFAYTSGSGQEVPAVKEINLEINEGEFVALVGHNGSGKSTVAKLLNGLILPDSGEVMVNGLTTLDKKNLFEIRKNVGVVFQNPDNQMIATIIEDDVAFGPENIGLEPLKIRERVDWALKCVGMYEHREGTPYRLSGGQKQRVAIAGVLAVKPKVMVLDESTAMLDPIGRKEVMDVVDKLNKEEGMTVIMITHFMEEAVKADRIVVLDGGEIILEGGKEIFLAADRLKEAGLDVPAPTEVVLRLKEKGINLPPDIVTIEELVNELCR